MTKNRSTNSLTRYVVVAASGLIGVVGIDYPHNSIEPIMMVASKENRTGNYLYSAILANELVYKYYDNADSYKVVPRKVSKVTILVNTKSSRPDLYTGD